MSNDNVTEADVDTGEILSFVSGKIVEAEVDILEAIANYEAGKAGSMAVDEVVDWASKALSAKASRTTLTQVWEFIEKRPYPHEMIESEPVSA